MNRSLRYAIFWLGCFGCSPLVPVRPRLGPTEHEASDAGSSLQPALAAPPPAPVTSVRTGPVGHALADEWLLRADGLFDDGAYDEAGAWYERATRLGLPSVAPRVGVLRVRLAKACPELGVALAAGNRDVEDAARELQSIVREDPSYGPGHLELGRALLLLGRATEAGAVLGLAQDQLPNVAEAHSALGVAYLAQGDASRALGPLRRASELEPNSAPRRTNLGTVLLMNQRMGEAIAEYEAALRLDPSDAKAHSDLATALLAEDRVERAVEELEQAIKLEPKRATFFSNLGYARQHQGKFSEAMAAYRTALRLDPTLVSAWVNLATVLAKQPSTRGEARRALHAARKLDPSDPRVKVNLEELDALERSPVAPKRESAGKIR